jgi:formylglycine-generating enzyme required for sulfatase activity
MDPAWQRGRLERRLWACEDVAQAQPLRAQMRLAELTAEAVNNRSGFDLMGVLAEVNALQANPKTALTEAQLAQLLALTQTLGEDAAAGAVPVQAGRPEFAQLADEERLFEAFSSGDLVGLRAVLEQEREALQGRLLPDGMVMWWLERENTLAWWRSEPPAPQAGELWAALGPYLSQWGVLRLAAGLGVGVLKLIQSIPWIKDSDVKADGQQLQLSLSCEGGHLIRVDIPAGPPKSDSKWWRCASGQGEIPGAYFDVKVSGVVQRFRWIEPGSFLMGSPETEPNRSSDEGPQHRVTLTQGFWLADTACTQALWLAVVGGKNPSYFKGDDELPVERVSWDDVMEKFVPKLQALLPEGVEATLPSEAQWEYACRAGTSTAYVWGDEVNPQLANIDESQTTPVKTYPANPWGLFDMHGNVWEWCFDSRRTYEDAEAVDPLGAVGDGPRALRGGSWFHGARNARSAARREDARAWRHDLYGFRLALRFKPSK